MLKNVSRYLLMVFVAFFVIAGLFSIYLNPVGEKPTIAIGELVKKINAGEVASVVVVDDALTVTLKNGAIAQATKESGETFSTLLSNYEVDSAQLQEVAVRIDKDNSLSFWLVALLPFLFPFLLIAAFLYFMMRQVQGANSRAMMFGQSRAREVTPQDSHTKVTFKDVAGVKEAKAELVE